MMKPLLRCPELMKIQVEPEFTWDYSGLFSSWEFCNMYFDLRFLFCPYHCVLIRSIIIFALCVPLFFANQPVLKENEIVVVHRYKETTVNWAQLSKEWHWHVTTIISSQKIYGVKHHIVEIRGDVTMRDDEQLKIELLSQWKLEAEFRNSMSGWNVNLNNNSVSLNFVGSK